ncbi:GH36-type glycosyl hydrolase domain-containing protein [Acuticoccus sediminis]|nr:cellobiose phosphorylase [Acuticoccus sediminis]
MGDASPHRFRTPTDADLGLRHIANGAGLNVSVLGNGAVFALTRQTGRGHLMLGQILGSGIGGGLLRLFVRTDSRPGAIPLIGPGGADRVGVLEDRVVWEREVGILRCRVTLVLAPSEPLWLWRAVITNLGSGPVRADAVLVQDLGLGERPFLMNNEAFACQYMDHHVAVHPTAGPVIMSRQNLMQLGGHPWAAHGCLDGAVAYATDFRQVAGPAHRATGELDLPFGTALPSQRMQGEAACAAFQSPVRDIAPGETVRTTFFGVLHASHAGASDDGDLSVVALAERAASELVERDVPLAPVVRSIVETAPALRAEDAAGAALATRYPDRTMVEEEDGATLSFFVPDGSKNRHVVLRDKETAVLRRHGTILVSGTDWLPGDGTLSLTTWMHGVFAAQLSLGNTSLNKLFSVARDGYDLIRSGGLRMLVDTGEGWQRLAVPSVYEMGIWDCRWVYLLADRTITVSVAVSPENRALATFSVTVDGAPCRFLVYAQLVLGEHDLAHHGEVEVDADRSRIIFRPDPGSAWGGQYPDAAFHFVVGTPGEIDAIGGEELLFDGAPATTGAFAAMRTRPTGGFRFAVAGSLASDGEANEAADAWRARPDMPDEMAFTAAWQRLTNGIAVAGSDDPDAGSALTLLPWMIHDGRVHVAAPHGLEQYSGAAWGTRDVCQGPVELLLALRQDETVKAILATVFAEQDVNNADWPQWFMLDPYAWIRSSDAHGDVIVWPLKALCDYVEATGDGGILEQSVGWRDGGARAADRTDPVAVHVDRLLAAVEARFVPGTHLIRYGEGDWNDSLQPVDPAMRERMVSGWTVALLYRQARRYAAILARFGHDRRAAEVSTLAGAIREDFRRHLMPGGIVAGYADFDASGGAKVLFHPDDTVSGIHYSLIAMTEAMHAGLLSPEETERHLDLIREHLSFPDGVRLMERPLPYHGGIERIFRRAESAAYFGREIGLMYTHAHLRIAEVLAATGDAAAFWDALAQVNPVVVTERVANAAPRQRNAYFSSSDADVLDRYQASRDWDRVRAGTLSVEGGWRIYSSGPGILVSLILGQLNGRRGASPGATQV